MNGTDLKKIIEQMLITNNVDRQLCDDLLDKLANTTGDVDTALFKEVIERLDYIYKIKYTWSEFNDKHFADWKRIRAAIEHENTLVNHRLTWLLSSQTVLITAYTLGFIQWSNAAKNTIASQVYPAILIILALLGIALGFLIWRTLLRASSQLNRLERWWFGERTFDDLSKRQVLNRDTAHKEEEALTRTNPPLQGRSRSGIDQYLNGETIPLLFIISWGCIIGFSGFSQLKQIQETLLKNWLTYILVGQSIIIIFGLVIFVIPLIRRKP